MNATEKPKKPKAPKGKKEASPPVGVPPLTGTPKPPTRKRTQSRAPAVPPEDETLPVASDYGSTGGTLPKDQTGLDATPRSGSDLGHRALKGSGGSEHHEQRVRERAYQIWERDGGSGDPEDHWYRAERELKNASAGPHNPGQPKADLAAASAPGPRQSGEDLEKRQDQLLDEAVEETFPASDPISPKRITK
jgi:hypothetical protein